MMAYEYISYIIYKLYIFLIGMSRQNDFTVTVSSTFECQSSYLSVSLSFCLCTSLSFYLCIFPYVFYLKCVDLLIVDFLIC